jgi:hypothetical protein
MLVGVTLIAQTVTQVRSSELSASGWLLAALILLGAGCILLGFVTPVTAILIGLVSITFAFSSLAQLIDIVVLSAAIALLGPGAFSIDARMFGRREILITHASRSPKPLVITLVPVCHSFRPIHHNAFTRTSAPVF